jgi:PmbA protein
MKLETVLTAIERVRADGRTIDRWQVHGTESRRISLGIKDREAGNAHAPLSLAEGSNVHYLFVWSDGLVCRGMLERQQDPRSAFEESRATAYEDPDAAHVLGPAEFSDVALWDEPTAGIAGGDTTLFAARLTRVRAAIDGAGARTWSGSFSAGASASRMVTSAGLDVESRGTSYGWFVSVDGEASDGFGARRPESESDFDARLEQLMRTAAQVAVVGAAPPPGTHRVLLHPRVVESYVLGTLLQNLDGSAVAHEESAFKRADFGSDTARLREDIGLSIDPLQPYKTGAYRFTGYGLPAAPCTFVANGRLIQPILDVKYARRLGLKPTPVPFASDTASFGTPDRLAHDEALSRADVMVHSVLGVHTQDRISGDFSLSAPLTLALRQGRPAGRLRGTISGNLWQILNSPDLRFVDVPHETTPGMLFACRFDSH